MMAHCLLYGNAYFEIERNGKGDPIALWPLHPGNVRVDRFAGEKIYLVRIDGQI
jgi:phage portal protein BeeE